MWYTYSHCSSNTISPVPRQLIMSPEQGHAMQMPGITAILDEVLGARFLFYLVFHPRSKTLWSSYPHCHCPVHRKKNQDHDQMIITSSNDQSLHLGWEGHDAFLITKKTYFMGHLLHDFFEVWFGCFHHPLCNWACSMLFPQERFGRYPHDGSMARLYLEPYMKTINIKQT